MDASLQRFLTLCVPETCSTSAPEGLAGQRQVCERQDASLHCARTAGQHEQTAILPELRPSLAIRAAKRLSSPGKLVCAVPASAVACTCPRDPLIGGASGLVASVAVNRVICGKCLRTCRCRACAWATHILRWTRISAVPSRVSGVLRGDRSAFRGRIRERRREVSRFPADSRQSDRGLL